jgi:hypothetical protein
MKESNFTPKHEHGRRGRVTKNSPLLQEGGGTHGSKARGGTNARTRGRGNKQRLSIISTASTTPPKQRAESWCDKCSRMNRQLYGYLLEILTRMPLATGPTRSAPERIIPEGYRRCSRQHHGSVAEPAMPLLPPPGCTTIPLVSGIHPGQLATTTCQRSAATGPFSQLGPGLDFAQRTNGLLPAVAGVSFQNRQNLFAIPENGFAQNSRAELPSHAQLPAPQPIQLPWNGSFEGPVATYLNSRITPFPSSGRRRPHR